MCSLKYFCNLQKQQCYYQQSFQRCDTSMIRLISEEIYDYATRNHINIAEIMSEFCKLLALFQDNIVSVISSIYECFMSKLNENSIFVYRYNVRLLTVIRTNQMNAPHCFVYINIQTITMHRIEIFHLQPYSIGICMLYMRIHLRSWEYTCYYEFISYAVAYMPVTHRST